MKRIRWNPLSNLSFRSKLIVSNAILASAIFLLMAYYLISRATASNDFLSTKLTQAVQEVTENELTASARRFASDLNQFFALLLSHMETVTSALQIEMANEGAYEPISASSLSRLPQGSWDNSNSEPGAIFVSNRESVPDAVLSEIGVVRQIDLIVPGIMEKNPDIAAIYFGSVLGEMLHYPNIDLAARLPSDYDVTQQPWFRAADPEANPTRGTVCNDPYHNASQKPIITCSTPLFDVADRFRGVVAMDIYLEHVTDLVSKIPVGKTGYAVVIDSKGHVIAMPQRGHADFGLELREGEDPLQISVLKTAPIDVFGVVGWMTSGISGLRRITIAGTEKYMAFSPITALGYSLGLVVPVEELQGPVLAAKARLSLERRDTLINLITGSALVLVGFLAAILWLGNSLTSPIGRLTQSAKRIAEGDLNHNAVAESKDEIGVLAGTLNLMTKNLRDLINNLELRVEERTVELVREKEFSEALVRNSPVAIVSLDAESRVMAWNPGAERLFGYTEEEAIGNNIDNLVANDESLRVEAAGFWEQAGRSEFHTIAKRTRKDGTLMDVDLRGVSLSVNGEVVGLIAIYNDITELQRAREEAERLFKAEQRRAAELAIINTVGLTLTEELDLTAMVERVGEKLRDTLNLRNIGIGIYNEKENIMQVPYVYRDGVRISGESFALNAFNQRVAKTGRSLLVNRDAERLWRRLGGISPTGEVPRAFVMVPLMAGRELVGGISLQDFEDEHAFDDLSVGLLETVASNMGTAISKARLFDETQRLLKETNQRAAELAILNDVGKVMSSTLDVRTLTRDIGDLVHDIFEVEITDILLYDRDSGMVRLAYSFNSSYFENEPPWRLEEGGLTSRIIVSGQPLLLNSARELEEYGAVAYLTTPPDDPDPQSFLGVPILVGDRVLGVLDVQSYRPDAFSENQLRLLQTLSSNMGVALENARLFDESQRLLKETQQRAAELSAISKVSQALVAKTELDSLIQLIGDQIHEIFDADIVYVALLDPQTDLIHFPYQVGETFVTLRIGDGLTGRIIETGRPLLMNKDVNARSQEMGITNIGREALSYLGVPIQAGGETIGVISVQSTTEEGLFTDDSLRLLTTIAANAGAAIQTARLYSETQRNASQMATIASVGRDLAATLDLQEVIRTVVENVHSLFQATDTVLRLLDSDGKSLRTALALGGYAEQHVAKVILLGDGIAGNIAQSGVAEVVGNVDLDPRGVHITGTPEWDEIPQTVMVAPLIAGNRTLGVISVYRDRPQGIFSQADLDFLLGLGRQAAFAIQNAILFRDQQNAREHAETLQAVTQALSRTLSLQEVFDLILTELQKVVPYDSCSVQQLVDGDRERVIVGGRGYPNIDEIVGIRFLTAAEDPGSHVIRTRQSHIVEDVSALFPAFRSRKHGAGRIHGWLGVPLIFGDRLIGMLALDKYERAFYTPKHAELAMAFAAQAAVAIENARLFDTERAARQQAEVQSRHMATIANVGRELSATLDLQKVIRTVVENVHGLFQARDTILRLVESDGKSLRTALALGEYAGQVTATILTVGEGITGEITRSGIAEVIEDVELDRRRVRISGTPLHFETPQTMMVTPLIAGNRTIGVLSVSKDRTKGIFSQVDLDFLVGLGRQAAIAIENSRLFDEIQTRNREITESLEQQTATSDILRVMAGSPTDVQPVFDAIIERATNLCGGTGGLAYWVRDGNIHLVSYYSQFPGRHTGYHVFQDLLSRYPRPFDESDNENNTTVVIRDRVILHVADMKTDPRVTPSNRAYAVGYGFGACLWIPLVKENQGIGALVISRAETELFTEKQIALVETFANQAVIAIENVRLFNETKRLLQETEQRAAELQIINNIGQTLTERHDLNTMIQRVGDELRQALQVEAIGIIAFDPKADLVIAQYIHNKWFTAEQFSLSRFKLSLRLSMRGLGRSWVVNTNAEKSWKKFSPTTRESEIPKSFILLPLLAGKDAVGGITIADYDKENAFTDISIGMLETIASNLGTAIQNVRLFEETRRLFRDAEEARASAEQANKAKSTFLANMSHELRTPLNAIIGFTRIVRKKAEGALPEKQIQNLDKVLSSSEHLLGLINTVLDIAKIEAGRMDVIPAKFDLSVLVDQCANLATPLLKPNIMLERQVDDSIGIVFSDQDKIKQIVLNLLSNAAKFTHEGKILLRVQKMNEETVTVSVTDNGIGISEEALGRIFEEFQQADSSTTRQYGGTGLGLSISRNLARLLGGDLVATSQLGRGSTFTLSLPVHFGRKPASPVEVEAGYVPRLVHQSGADSVKHRILLIDDDPDALYLLQEGLGTNEFEVIGARTGHEGLQLARQHQPKAILLDILMPRSDGWQILNDLKSEPATAHIPVILLTIVDKKALGFKLGAADYLLKPLNPAAVMESLHRAVGEKGSARKCVIVVDDDPHVADMLRQTLPESEFDLAAAEDGVSGLQAIRAQRPDVILLDLVMPKLDGFGVIEALRSDSELRKTPIIVISSKDLTPEESRRLRESVNFVIKKQGFDGNLLKQEINSIVKK